MKLNHKTFHRPLPYLLLTGLLTAPSAHSLTLGKAAYSSTNDQHLLATLPIQWDDNELSQDIQIRLAPPDKFDEYQLVWFYAYSKLKINTGLSPDGKAVLQISHSKDIDTSPLRLLLEIHTADGLNRYQIIEYINPGVALQGQISHGTFQTHQSIPRGYDPERLHANEHTYGPVLKTDTLWSIAKNTAKLEGQSPQRMLEAIHAANPDAFNQNDIHSMKAGATLNIPSFKQPQPADRVPAEQPTAQPLELISPTTDTTHTLNDSQDTPQIRNRIEALEQQVSLMQNLLRIRDQELARLSERPLSGSDNPLIMMILSVMTGISLAVSLLLGFVVFRRGNGLQPTTSNAQGLMLETVPGLAEASKDSDFSFSMSIDPKKNSMTAQEDETETDWTGHGDCETLMDLAKAYLDMGDLDQASRTARTILADGNTLQKDLAQALLNEISSLRS